MTDIIAIVLAVPLAGIWLGAVVICAMVTNFVPGFFRGSRPERAIKAVRARKVKASGSCKQCGNTICRQWECPSCGHSLGECTGTRRAPAPRRRTVALICPACSSEMLVRPQ